MPTIHSLQERMSSSLGKIQSDSEKYLLQHRFGDQLEDDEVEDEELVKAFEEYKGGLDGCTGGGGAIRAKMGLQKLPQLIQYHIFTAGEATRSTCGSLRQLES